MRPWLTMRTIAFFLALALLVPCAMAQPSGYKDRLARVRDLVNSSELALIWSQGTTFGGDSCRQRIYDLDLTRSGGPDSTLIPKPLAIDSAVAGSKRLAMAAGNFLGGSVKHFVAAWAGPGNTVTVSIPDIQASTLSWSSASRLSIPGLTPYGAKRKIRLAAGDFFGDRQDEFVLGFEGADSTIHLQVFSFNPGSLEPQPRGSIHDEHIVAPVTNLDNWDLVTGDFDGDGYHDIALLYVKPFTGLDWGVYAKIYTVDSQGDLVPKASREIFHRPGYPVYDINISGASGDFDGDAALELACGFDLFQGDQSGFDTFVYLLDIRNGLDTIITSDSARIARDEVGPNDLKPFAVAAGDLNNDGHSEVVLMSGETFFIYSTDEHLVPLYRSKLTVPTTIAGDFSDRFLAVGDMDADQRAEIVVAGTGSVFVPTDGGVFQLLVYSVDSTLATFTLKGRRMYENFTDLSGVSRNYAIALGDFDGDRVRLGAPVHYTKKGIMQPTVVLYSPPVHYDIFDTTIVDLSGCYPGQSCGFNSSYVQSTTVDTTVTTEVHEDWAIDNSLLIQQPTFSVRAEHSYGNKFSRSSSSTHSFTITTGRIAAGDDWIYVNVYDVDYYEYPVYDGQNPDPIGHFIVSIPGTPRPLWVESKDDDVLGNLFRPDHEIGNVLSYPMVADQDTSRVITDFPEQTVGSTGSSFVSLQLSTFQENGVSSSWDSRSELGFKLGSIGSVGIGVGEFVQASVSFPIGVEVGVSGEYGEGAISTQTVRVGQSLEVESDLGNLKPEYGTSGTYYVKPYAYWTSYGALALDYKVSALPTGSNSFWQSRYGGKRDLAFSLPWRYDLQKGLSLPNNDVSYLQRTRDIFLSTSEPRGGDTVAIYARVHNFGLQAVTTPVTVRFYKGDPASGGTLIGEATIDTTIAPRTWIGVRMPWAIGLAETLSTVRIYGVIDPDNTVSNEVHEDNNKGWAPAVATIGTVTGVASPQTLPEKVTLYQAYPNPFNPMTTIRFDLPVVAHVTITVYNVLGQRVVTLADEVRQAGTHSVHFNGAGLASGVYFYRLDATAIDGSLARQVINKKMLLVK